MAKTLKNFRLSDEAIKQLDSLAKAQDRTGAYIIEKLILSTLPADKKEKPAKSKS